MQKIIRRSIISGKISAPPSKAVAHRALVACCLSGGQSLVSNVPDLPEIHSTINALGSLGADIVFDSGVADIFAPEEIGFGEKVDCEGSNTALKLLAPIAACLGSRAVFSASGSLQKKSVEPFALYLNRLGGDASTQNGYLPLSINGGIGESEMIYPPSLGTQFLSGLLLGAPLRIMPTEIEFESPLPNFSYVQSTIEMMKRFGISFAEDGPEGIALMGEQDYDPPGEFAVPESPYLSSYYLLAGAVAGSVEIEGMMQYPEFDSLMRSFGNSMKSSESSITCFAGALARTELNAVLLGELLPHAFVLASLCSEECKFEGIAALGPRKEYRMRLLARELSKMGASITETGNGFFVRGGRLVGAEVDCEGDPKVGMALSIAAIASAGATTLQGMECIYPEFFLNLTGLGALIR